MSCLGAVLLLHLLNAATTSSTLTATTSFPDFQHLNVQELLAAAMAHSPAVNEYRNFFNEHELTDEAGGKAKYRAKLIHWDRMPDSSMPVNRTAWFSARLDRDVRRDETLSRRLSGGKVEALGDKRGFYGVDDFGSDVVSGMDQGSGEYFVRIGVGEDESDGCF